MRAYTCIYKHDDLEDQYNATALHRVLTHWGLLHHEIEQLLALDVGSQLVLHDMTITRTGDIDD